VLCDKGSENAGVSPFMINERGPNRGSWITGHSVHNQRIERFWRDLFQGCISLFYYFFYSLEDDSLLDPLNSLDLFCLHYVFLPQIKHHLLLFRESYSHHRLRTESNLTPMQLWINGMSTCTSDDDAVNGLCYMVSVCESSSNLKLICYRNMV
jgi:hypothetical protein